MPLSNRVLVADSERGLCDLLAEELTELGLTAERAYSSQEALDLILHGNFDGVIADALMPDFGGFGLIERLHHHVREENAPPIVLLTTFNDDQTLKRAYDLGAEAVFEKPFNYSNLTEFVTTIMTARKKQLRKRAHRAEVELKVRLETEGIDEKTYVAQASNVSRGGMFLTMEQGHIPVGHRLRFLAHGDDPGFRIGGQGVCRWVRESDVAGVRGFGIEFTGISERDRTALYRLINFVNTQLMTAEI